MYDPDDVVWDVGANIGLYSRWLISQLNARRVIAFEPMSQNVPELEHNLKLGGVEDRVTVVRWALSDSDGEVDFQIDDMQSASGSLDSVRHGAASQGRAALRLPPKTEKVVSRCIDSILEADELPAPDVLKVDVEGAEALVLRGGDRFFTAKSPRVLMEMHGVEMAKECLQFLLDRGYSVAGCVPRAWDENHHLKLNLGAVRRIQDKYDVHFIAASKNAADIPDRLNYRGACGVDALD